MANTTRRPLTLRKVLFIGAACQAFLWVELLGSPYSKEVIVRVLMLTAAAVTLFAVTYAAAPRWLFVASGVIHISAIAVYCSLPAVAGGESVEGFQMMVMSGLVIIVIGPPMFNTIILACLAVQRDGGLPSR